MTATALNAQNHFSDTHGGSDFLFHNFFDMNKFGSIFTKQQLTDAQQKEQKEQQDLKQTKQKFKEKLEVFDKSLARRL